MSTVSQRYGVRGARTAGAAVGATAGAAASEQNAPVLLMVSGGADSTALTLMACTGTLDIDDGRGVAHIARERLHVLHVNHHLRGAASDGDEAFVRELCERLGLPLCVEHAQFTELNGQNLEAAAREVRYAAARRLIRELSQQAGVPRSAARVLTAHTASDRAETFFMNAIKGSGAAGLSSIPRRRNIIVRPLLDHTHEELVRYLEVLGQPWREDESNQDTSYLRNYVRHRLMPVAAERNAGVAHTVSAACDVLGDEDAFMSQLAATALRSCTRRSESGLMVLDAARLAAAEVAIARRMVRVAVKQLAPEARLEFRHVEAVLACVARGEGSLTLPEGIDARLEFGTLSLRTPAVREALAVGWLGVPSRMTVAYGMEITSELLRVPAGKDPVELARNAEPGAVYIDAAALGYAESDLGRMLEGHRGSDGIPAEARTARLWVDVPAAGDVLCPLGMQGRSKKLSDLLNEAQIPLAERSATPVVRTAPGGAIVWVAGIRLDDRFNCSASTRVLVNLLFRPVRGV